MALVDRLSPQIALVSLISAVLLIPCFWQPHIEAGDMLSHLYNAWLAKLIAQGQAPGLWVVPLWTNTVFEVVETSLQRVFSVTSAERIGASAAVLIFFWGAFALISTVNGRRAWFIAPVVAMLAYGFVFHQGLTNFYISVGLLLIFFTLVWRGGLRNWIIAVPIFLLACMAHASAAVWILGLAAYALIARKLRPRLHLPLFLLSLVALLAIRQYWVGHFESRWSPRQLLSITGADQVWVFGRQYAVLALTTVLLWGALAFQRGRDWQHTATRVFAQLYLLSAAAVVLLPSSIKLSSFQIPFSSIYERMSLVTAVLACVIAASAKPKRWHALLATLVAAFYFSFLYLDHRAINRIEAKVESLVSQLPPQQRVLALLPPLSPSDADAHFLSRMENHIANSVAKSGLGKQVIRLFPECRLSLIRIIDRACIGRCFSYANYEPATHQFRVRAAPGNKIVEWDAEADSALLNGYYVVKQADLPLYQIYRCGEASTDLCIRSLAAGEVNGAAGYPVQRKFRAPVVGPDRASGMSARPHVRAGHKYRPRDL
jgi:hypothetical protein